MAQTGRQSVRGNPEKGNEVMLHAKDNWYVIVPDVTAFSGDEWPVNAHGQAIVTNEDAWNLTFAHPVVMWMETQSGCVPVIHDDGQMKAVYPSDGHVVFSEHEDDLMAERNIYVQIMLNRSLRGGRLKGVTPLLP